MYTLHDRQGVEHVEVHVEDMCITDPSVVTVVQEVRKRVADKLTMMSCCAEIKDLRLGESGLSAR